MVLVSGDHNSDKNRETNLECSYKSNQTVSSTSQYRGMDNTGYIESFDTVAQSARQIRIIDNNIQSKVVNMRSRKMGSTQTSANTRHRHDKQTPSWTPRTDTRQALAEYICKHKHTPGACNQVGRRKNSQWAPSRMTYCYTV